MADNTLKMLEPADIKVVKNMPDFQNDPYFVKKNKRAVDNLKKYGLPFANKKKKK